MAPTHLLQPPRFPPLLAPVHLLRTSLNPLGKRLPGSSMPEALPFYTPVGHAAMNHTTCGAGPHYAPGSCAIEVHSYVNFQQASAGIKSILSAGQVPWAPWDRRGISGMRSGHGAGVAAAWRSRQALDPVFMTSLLCGCQGRHAIPVSSELRPAAAAAALTGRAVLTAGGAGQITGTAAGVATSTAGLPSSDDVHPGLEGTEYVPHEDDRSGRPVLRLYNTMTRQKEVFRPKVAGKVGMYVCGVTAYDFSHIGHARVYVAFDVLYRYLLQEGYEVKYVRNFTDVDDKIINRAAETGENPVALSARFCSEFQRDMEALRCLPPTVEPRVSTHIHHIIAMIGKILGNGHAYVLEGGDVFFSVDSMPQYGALSGRKQEENRAGERVGVDGRKRNAADFALWKSAKPGEPCWESPWGPGRPGWHIECSAMSAEHLGPSFDIHGGGRDLIFPHHENELAQSCAACRGSHVGYWVHNGFVTVEEEKMSKSLGNFFTIREVLALYPPLALRWFLLGSHYRSPVNYSLTQMERAAERTFYLYQTLSDCEKVLSAVASDSPQASKESAALAAALDVALEDGLADDLNTSRVMVAVAEALKAMNDFLQTRKGRRDKTKISSLRLLQSGVERVISALGMDLGRHDEVLDEFRDYALTRAGVSETELESIMKARAEARAAKDFALSDDIRAQLAVKGIMLMDGGDGMMWKPGLVEDGG